MKKKERQALSDEADERKRLEQALKALDREAAQLGLHLPTGDGTEATNRNAVSALQKPTSETIAEPARNLLDDMKDEDVIF